MLFVYFMITHSLASCALSIPLLLVLFVSVSSLFGAVESISNYYMRQHAHGERLCRHCRGAKAKPDSVFRITCNSIILKSFVSAIIKIN